MNFSQREANIFVPGASGTACREVYARNKDGTVIRHLLPFYVRLLVMKSDFDSEGDYYDGVFLYADCLEQACPMAAKLWWMWRKNEKILTPFPRLKDGTSVASGIAIDDEDFAEYWKGAKRHPHNAAGSLTDPSAFMVIGQEIFGLT